MQTRSVLRILLAAHLAFAPAPLVAAPLLPNDTRFAAQWALGPSPGMGLPEAWAALGTGKAEILVAVLDSGIDCQHPDLAGNLWTNPNDPPGDALPTGNPDGDPDDDHNGWVDDVHGIDTLNPGQPPCDATGHGTWTASIIGAVGNNGDAGTAGESIAGVVWKTGIVSCKMMFAGSSDVSYAVQCLEYVAKLRNAGHRIVAVNASWGDLEQDDPMLRKAIADLDALGILFVASAGRCFSDCDLDEYPHYPASYDLPNLISVAAINRSGALIETSRRGRHTVHVAAPGDDIETLGTGATTTNKGETSLAAPQVSGLVALLSQDPTLSHRQIRNLILTGGERNQALAQVTVTGRRVRAPVPQPGVQQSCSAQVRTRLAPKWRGFPVVPVGPVELRALSLDCDSPGAPPAVKIERLGAAGAVLSSQQQVLAEGGNGASGDGLFATVWGATPGRYRLTFFPGETGFEDAVTVTVE